MGVNMQTVRSIAKEVSGVIPPAPAPDGGSFMPRLVGNGSPEGVLVGYQGDFYTDLDTGTKYGFIGVSGTKIGWT